MPADKSRPQDGSGYIVLAMGKMGAFELNYSSDIDLIVFYDPAAPALPEDAAPARAIRAPDPAAGEAVAGAHRRRLRVPHRSAAAARSGLDRDRDLDRGGARPITKASGRTGSAPRMIKARACAGDIAAGEAILERPVALRLAQISRFRRRRRRACDEAADQRLSRPRRDRGRRPQHQARPRRHSRDRVFRADPAIDRRRPQSGVARPRYAHHARQAGA